MQCTLRCRLQLFSRAYITTSLYGPLFGVNTPIPQPTLVHWTQVTSNPNYVIYFFINSDFIVNPFTDKGGTHSGGSQ